MTLLVLLGVAFAHPSDAASWGRAIAVDVQDARVVIDYRVEIPGEVVILELHDAVAAGNEATFGTRKLASLREGLDVRLDGDPAVFTTVPVVQRSDDPRFVPYHLHLEAPLAAGPHALEIVDRNGRGAVVSLATVRIAPRWSLLATSLVEVSDDGVIRDHDGLWRSEPDAGRTTLQLRPAGPLARWLRPAATPARDAVALPFAAALAEVQPRSAPVALAAALAAAAAFAAAPLRRADLAGIGLVLGVAAAGWAPLVLIVAAGVLAAGVAAARGSAWAIGLAIGAAAASFGDVRAAVPVAMAGALGLLTRRAVRGTWAEALGVAAALALGLGLLWRAS